MSDDMLPDVESPVSETPDVSPDTSVATEQAEPASPEGGAEQEQSQAQQRSVWDAFRTLPHFQGQDDVAIARRLYGALEREGEAKAALAQYQQYMPVAQEYLRNRPEFDEWRKSRNAPAHPQQAQQPAPEQPIKKWWNPPELRDSYKQYLVKDENGREIISPEAPLDAKHALYEYQKYKADFAQTFLTDPEKALGPMVQDIAQQQAAQIVQQQFQQFAQQTYVSNLEQANRDWLFGEDGRTPTAEGEATRHYIDEAAARGIQDPEARWEYATMRVELDLHRQLNDLRAQNLQRESFEGQFPTQESTPPQQPPVVSNKAQADIDFLRREATRNPSRSASYAEQSANRQPLTFEQKLARQFGRETAT